MAVVNSPGTYQVVEYDNTTAPPTVVADTTVTGATLLGVSADGFSVLFAIGTNGLRRVPFPVGTSLTGTDITGTYPGPTGVSVTAGNGGWETYSTFAANAAHYLVPAAAAAPLHSGGGHTAAQDAAWGSLGAHLAVVHTGSPRGLLSLYSVGARPAGAFSGSWGDWRTRRSFALVAMAKSGCSTPWVSRTCWSTLIFAVGQTAAALTITGYGNDGSVAFYNAVGQAHFIVNMAGFFSSASL